MRKRTTTAAGGIRENLKIVITFCAPCAVSLNIRKSRRTAVLRSTGKELDSWLNVYNQITWYAGFMVQRPVSSTCAVSFVLEMLAGERVGGGGCWLTGYIEPAMGSFWQARKIPKANIFEVYSKQKICTVALQQSSVDMCALHLADWCSLE